MAPAPAPTETWPARFSDQGSPGSRAAVSVHPETRQRPADAVAGLLASLSIFASLVGLAYRPARLIPGALFLALLAVAMSPRHQRLAGLAVGIGAACFMIGMAAAVVTDHPLF